MTHDRAVLTIRKLAPKLNAEKPDDVLIKYASEHDLSPAQLHKLSQTYNTHAQLSKMASAEDRGASCYQIDSADLIARYVEGDPEKSAAVRFIEESDDVERLDLNAELLALAFPKSASAAMEPEPAVIPALLSPEDMVKAAGVDEMKKIASQVRVAYWEARTDLQLEGEALLKQARREAGGSRFLELGHAEEDAMHAAHPAFVAVAMTKLARMADGLKPSKVVMRFDGELKKRAFAHSSPNADRIARMANLVAEMYTLEKFAANTGSFTIDPGPPEAAQAGGESAAEAPASGGGVMGDMSAEELADVMSKLDPNNPEDAAIIAEINGAKAESASPAPAGIPKPTPNASAAPAATTSSVPNGAGGGKGGASSSAPAGTGAAAGQGKSSWLANLIGAITKPVDAVATGVAGAAESADKTLQRVTGKERQNKAQRGTDMTVADIRRSIQIRRLIATDPVLRDADPQMVLRLYNALAESNPAAAQNMEAMRLALREATSYEGVTPDTLKTMGDIRRTSGQSEAQEHENSKRRYSIPT